jgi:cobalt-zinc-cadmium efflux system outer membrane protein
MQTKTNVLKTILLIASPFFLGLRARTQEMPNLPQDHAHAQHQSVQMHGVQTAYPRMGRAQEHPQGKLFTLEQAQQLATDSNPTLRQAEAEIRAAQARQQQSGLYPNPIVGYTGDEIRGGSIAGGKQGFYVQQTIITGNKLANNRQVFSKEIQIAQAEAAEQKIRVQTAIRSGFLRVLAAQELLDARRDLAKIEQDCAETERLLGNTGQADETEILQAEISARRQKLATHMQENALLEDWRALAAVIGKPDLPLMVVSGDLQTGWPELNEEQITDKIAAESPATRIATTVATRADAEILQARRAAIPDLELRGGLIYNNEPIGSMPPHATGWEGLADVAIQIPIFNRNQGNISAAQARSDRAKLETQRVSLTLHQRTTSVLDEYANAKLMAIEYRKELLPRAKKAYALMNEKYGQMLASYPRVIEMQRKLYQLQCEYIQALEALWTSGICLEGYLLTDGLESPVSPTEVDRPVRELNIPLLEPNTALEP